MALLKKRRDGVPAGQIKISGFCRFLSPYFATGCHTFYFKIATAAVRPRNDTKLGRFCLNQAPFCQMQSLSIELLRRFPAKPLGHVIARSEATRQSLTERNGIPERNLEKQRETVCVLQARHHLLLSVSCSRASPRDAIPSALRNL